jgi:hypothetical protein
LLAILCVLSGIRVSKITGAVRYATGWLHCQAPVRADTVHFVRGALTADDLSFALVRAAHLEPPRQVADGLLSGADQPGPCLAGVTPLQARLRAAEVLIRAGLRDDAIAVVREAMRGEGQDPDGIARMRAAPVLADAGAADEAAALATAVLRERPGREYMYLTLLLYLSSCMRGNGQLAQAARIADEAAESVASLPGASRRNAGLWTDLKAEMTASAERARVRVVELREQAAHEGADPVQVATRRRLGVRRDAAAEIDAQRPWPALVDDRVLWWPEAEYGRLVRQLPELAAILGSPWREHTGRVESFLAGVAPGQAGAAPVTAVTGAAQVLLAHADFAKFAAYLETTGADPRLSTVQTAFTRHAGAGYAYPVRWPPGQRGECWCGSHKKYQRCCGEPPSSTKRRR